MVDVSRRTLIGSLVASCAALMMPVRAFARACRATLGTDAGPFYPVAAFPETTDLLGSGRPPGQVLHLLGRVVDRACTPIPGAVVEIWQCDAGGQYDHPRAPKTKALEKDFRYFAMTRAAGDGTFQFRTLRPAPYSVFGLQRAPHIHVRVKGAPRTVTTEIYFDGPADERLRTTDGVFQGRGPRKGDLVARLQPAADFKRRLTTPPDPGALACEYDLMVD